MIATLLIATPSLLMAQEKKRPKVEQPPDLPPGAEQIIPRGMLPAIFEPEFVSAEEAGLPDDQWVLGVVIDGEAHAYDLNLLNEHEVVNDVIGDRPVAAVW
jgi:hypothetical protein